MEQNENTSLFDLNIDQTSKGHLIEAARWGKFLSIVGFVVCGLIILAGIFFSTFMSSMSNRYGSMYSDAYSSSGMGAMMAVLYIVMAVIYFFPCLFLFRFSTKMKTALATNDQNTLNTSFQNIKAMFRYVGIITLIILIIYALVLIIAIIGAASR